MKPIFIILPVLALLMIGGIVVTEQDSSDAQTQTWTSGQCTVTLDDNGIVTVIGDGAMADYEQQTDQPWYSQRANMKHLMIMEGVTHIGSRAFASGGFVDVSFPSTLVNIKYAQFLGSGLKWVSIPNTVATLGTSVFSGCTSLGQVELPTNLTTIPNGTFMNCSSLKAIVIPDSVETIGSNAFDNSGLRNLYLSDNVETIGNYAFQNCSSLNFVRLGMGYDGTGNYIFQGCTALAKIAFSEGIMELGTGMFKGCTTIQSIVLPFTLREIKQDAFRDCTSLTIAVMSSRITQIDDNAFNGSGLGRLVFQGTTWSNATIGSNAFASTESSIGVHSGDNCANTKLDGKGGNTYRYNNLGGPDTWTSGSCTLTLDCNSGLLTISGNGAMFDYTTAGSMPWYSWNGATIVRVIKVGSGVTHIGNNAFNDVNDMYTGLNRIYWDNGGQNNLTIGDFAFRRCATVQIVTLPSSCISLGDSALQGIKGIRSLELPAQLTSMGTGALGSLRSCTDLNINLYSGSWDDAMVNDTNELMRITTASANTKYKSVDGILALRNGDLVQVGRGVTVLNIPSGTTAIGESAQAKGWMGKVVIPASVTSIGQSAFSNCPYVTQIEYGGTSWGVSTIGANAFALGTSQAPVTSTVFSPSNVANNRLNSYKGDYTTFNYLAEPTITVTIQVNDSSYGSVSLSQVILPITGGTATIDGNRINIGGTWVTATPTPATAQYTYAFSVWQGVPSGGTITSDVTITANFTRTTNEYTVTFQVNDDEFGSVSPTSVTVPYGTQIQTSSMNPNTLTIGSNTITATRSAWTPGAKYYFDSWSGIPSPAYVTGNVTITANFHKEAVSYTITFNVEPLGYGSISPSTVTAEYGTAITVENNRLHIGDVTVIPIPLDPTSEWVYTFHHWRNLPETVSGDATVTGVFTREARQYTVTFQADPEGLGTISPATVTAEYGTPITVQDNTITINGTTVTATPLPPTEDYKYVFVTWVNYRPTVTGDMTIIGNFERLDIFTVTYDANGGTVTSPESSERVAYGEYADLASFTAEKEGWVFIGWNSDQTQTEPLTEYRVTGETTLYAVYSEIVVYDIPVEEYIDGLTHTEYGQGGIMSILLMIIPLMLGLGIVMYLAQSMGIRVGRRRSRYTQAGTWIPAPNPLPRWDFHKCF